MFVYNKKTCTECNDSETSFVIVMTIITSINAQCTFFFRFWAKNMLLARKGLMLIKKSTIIKSDLGHKRFGRLI